MGKTAVFLILLLLSSSSVIAETKVNVNSTGDSNISVSSKTEGESKTCINGECTTTGGESHSKVCVNGECYESDGDINVESDNGNTKVNIKSSTGNNSIDKVSESGTDSNSGSGAEEESALESAKSKTDEKEEKIEVAEKNLFQKITDAISDFVETVFSFL